MSFIRGLFSSILNKAILHSSSLSFYKQDHHQHLEQHSHAEKLFQAQLLLLLPFVQLYESPKTNMIGGNIGYNGHVTILKGKP